LSQDAGDSLEELPDLEVDREEEATSLASDVEEEEADPNATTQPDLEPPAVATAPETPAEVEAEAVDPKATTAGDLQEIQPPGSVDGIAVDDLDGSPDDKLEIQTGAESLFDAADTDLSQYGDDESNDGEPER